MNTKNETKQEPKSKETYVKPTLEKFKGLKTVVAQTAPLPIR